MSILSPSGLETIDYRLPGWNFIFNKDFEMLAKQLLYVNHLLDVNVPSNHLKIHAGAILVWDTASSKFIAKQVSV